MKKIAETYFHINNGGITVGIKDHPDYGPTLSVRAGHFGNKTNEIEHYTDVAHIRKLAIEMIKAASYSYSGKKYCGEEIWKETDNKLDGMSLSSIVQDKSLSKETVNKILIDRLMATIESFNEELEEEIGVVEMTSVFDKYFQCECGGRGFGVSMSMGSENLCLDDNYRTCVNCGTEYSHKDGTNYKRKGSHFNRKELVHYEWEEFAL